MKRSEMKGRGETDISDSLSAIFDNLPNLITLNQIVDTFHYPKSTVYDWRCRPDKYDIEEDFFVKLGPRKLLIKRDTFKRWVYLRAEQQGR